MKQSRGGSSRLCVDTSGHGYHCVLRGVVVCGGVGVVVCRSDGVVVYGWSGSIWMEWLCSEVITKLLLS